MLSGKEKSELFRKLDDVKREITALRTELNQIDDQKESSFSKKEQYNREINNLIKQIKDNKNKRDSLTEEVKKDKEKRDKLNEEINRKISEIKKLNQEKKDTIQKHNIREDPSRIKAEMEKLEFSIETNVMSFDKEKGIMKRIKELKRRYQDAKVVSGVWEKTNLLSKDIDHLRKEAEEIHKKIQNRAKESQLKHEEMIKLSKDVDELKVKEEEAFKKFIELKSKFNEINEKLKEKLLGVNQVKEKVDKYQLERQEEEKSEEEKILRDKGRLVEEKIKKGQKLTTEDLLAIQSMDIKR